MVIGAARLRSQPLHNGFVQVASLAEAKHVEWDTGRAGALDNFTDAVAAARALVNAVRQDDNRLLPLRPRRLQRLDRLVGGVIQESAAARCQLLNTSLKGPLIRGERLGSLNNVIEWHQRREGARTHEID